MSNYFKIILSGKIKRAVMMSFLLIMYACTSGMESIEEKPLSFQPTKLEVPSLQASKTTTPTITPGYKSDFNTRTPTPNSSPVHETNICSPLEGISIIELLQPDLLKNPFQAPRSGMDDGHHGADFAYWSRADRSSMLGHSVLSILDGRVAGLINNRTPYGYAVIIETPLDKLSAQLIDEISVPDPIPTVQPAASLFCPGGEELSFDKSNRSLYVLYAHFNQHPEVIIDQDVVCGQLIGEVGTTGKSVNPHLHLEIRIGPSSFTFPEMAHYENSATTTEMITYCTWRVSGLFQMLDPVKIFQANNTLQP